MHKTLISCFSTGYLCYDAGSIISSWDNHMLEWPHRKLSYAEWCAEDTRGITCSLSLLELYSYRDATWMKTVRVCTTDMAVPLEWAITPCFPSCTAQVFVEFNDIKCFKLLTFAPIPRQRSLPWSCHCLSGGTHVSGGDLTVPIDSTALIHV